MQNKRPSFQFYPLDWLGDPNVMSMSAEERGAYIHLLASMWTTEDCSLPNDVDKLARIAGVNNTVITALLHCFKVVKNVLRHNRLDRERNKQDLHRKIRSEAGKLGMKKRYGKRKPQHRYNNDITSDITKSNFSSSSSSSKNITKFTNVNLVSDPNKESEKSKEEVIKKPTRLFEVCDLYFQAQRYVASGGKERPKLQDQSKEFIESFIKRNAKAAKLLSPYDNQQIKRAINYCVELSAQSKAADPDGGYDWTLETVGKKIDKVLSPNQVTHE